MKNGRGTVPSPSDWFFTFLRIVLKPVLIRQYNINSRIHFDIQSLTPPYIVISNHVNFWDPFFINIFIPHSVQFVTSDNIFRTAFYKSVMKLVGAIPKTKFKRDMDTIRAVYGVIARSGVIGIFPEARRSWNGRSFTTMPEVTRLLQKLKLPVVGVNIKGAYLSKPRWADTKRKGAVEIEYKKLLEKNDALYEDRTMLHERIRASLEHDDVEFAKTNNIQFTGERLAEYLERVLFLCPACSSLSSLRSDNDMIICESCGYNAVFCERGEFTFPKKNKRTFTTIAEWDHWQRNELRHIVENRCNGIGDELIYPNEPAHLYACERAAPLELIGIGAVSLSINGIKMIDRANHVHTYRIQEIAGINVQNGEKLEFYLGNTIMRIDLQHERSCAYKWFRAVRELRMLHGFEDGTL